MPVVHWWGFVAGISLGVDYHHDYAVLTRGRLRDIAAGVDAAAEPGRACVAGKQSRPADGYRATGRRNELRVPTECVFAEQGCYPGALMQYWEREADG